MLTHPAAQDIVPGPGLAARTAARAPKADETRRLPQLDALRGLAALSVVFSHYVELYFDTASPTLESVAVFFQYLALTPVSALWGGMQAVLLFFVLSGFVLTLMLENSRTGWGAYAIKRVFRLWLPYIVAIGFAVAMILLFGSRQIPELGIWVNDFLGVTVTAPAVLDHALFIGHFDYKPFDFVIWSLVHEMRISLIFPLLLIIVSAMPWKRALFAFFLLSGVSIVAYHLVLLSPYPLFSTYPATLHYVFFFVIGIVLAQHRDGVIRWYAALTLTQRVLLGAAGFASYTFFSHLPVALGIKTGLFVQWLGVPGVVIAMIFALASPIAGMVLRHPLAVYLGKISFSLYLYHGIIMLAALNIGYGRIPLPLLELIMFIVTLVISTLSYRFVELPSIRAGRAVAALWQRRLSTSSAA
jgi:peptidoglycan/LPS O-acetylase OafA/YrhL